MLYFDIIVIKTQGLHEFRGKRKKEFSLSLYTQELKNKEYEQACISTRINLDEQTTVFPG
jgi:hypothetical protein